ncbi:poly-beta-1,6-N-acetyl-D-glucosamine synthase [Anaeromyxobacter sp. PSR-1]|uniref:poly-beta-1,6-N-acetyl-D-glucosamine synthase n=1 Tax=unclassified Anaeromyxobacter TaxID=2620896 RepID=UPI0005E6EFC5|nr:poly-beta-1,6-N-acetyl-D-glucosamine synthase [Anaeromyxobacter sp. PSR-1]GAO01702.1 poly-beta-1,6-N-acetyl-D-glucosamine synthase [Anaeromyxobacter sp. PSR-1]
MTATLDSAWHGLLAFVFYYPLFMSFLWMTGAALFYWRFERAERALDLPPPLPHWPPVTVLIPSYNEGENAEETVSHALALDYPDFEVVAINDGSSDDTGAVLERVAARDPRLRVVHLAENQGKAMGLQAGALLARHEILVCIDGDALLDPNAAHWLVRHFVESPDVAAVTGNPRIRNRSTLLGRVQVGEFSSIVGIIKRAQRVFGRIFTVSGVITAFRKSAVHQVGYWSADMLTEDIDITWKLQRAGWDVRFEPRALTWILMPETLRGLWKQRLRWAMGGAQVLLKNIDAALEPAQRSLWPLLLEMVVSVAWSYAMVLVTAAWLIGLVLPAGALPAVGSPLGLQQSGVILGAACLAQFAFSTWLDSRYDRGLFRNLFWMIWYPFVFWVINCAATVVAYPKVVARRRGSRARWVSPDRGFRP